MSAAPLTESDSASHPTQTVPPLNKRRTLIATGVGNALEWYDWKAYGIFAPFFAAQFFAQGNSLSALLSTLAIFAVGFLMRPIGGFVFGWLADRKGRRLSMVTSISVQSAGSMLIGCSPTYASIGIGASLLLLVGRLAQGLAHGGELPSAQTYLSEVAPAAHRGRWSSAIYFSGTCGVLVATALGAALIAVFGADSMSSWGWRVPFIVGGLLGVVAIFMRRRLSETEAFTKEQSEGKTETRPSVLKGMWENRIAVLRVVGLTAGITVVYQGWTVAAPAYALSVQKLDANSVLLADIAALLIFLAVLPLCGALSDRIGRRPTMLVGWVGLAVLTIPLADLARAGAVWHLALATTIALVFSAFCLAILPVVFAELFPTHVRVVGTGLPYGIAVALFGGTAPLLQTWLSDIQASGVFNLYTVALALLGAGVVLTIPESRGKPLE